MKARINLRIIFYLVKIARGPLLGGVLQGGAGPNRFRCSRFKISDFMIFMKFYIRVYLYLFGRLPRISG
jgi:hypothetical protein